MSQVLCVVCAQVFAESPRLRTECPCQPGAKDASESLQNPYS